MMAEWPDVVDLATQLNVPGDGPAADLVARSLRSGTAFVQSRCIMPDPLDADGEPTEIPDDLFEAILLQAAKFYARRNSPEGVSGANDFGIVRVGRIDPDAEALMAPYLDWSIA